MSLKEQFNVKHEIRARCLLLLIQILVSESILVGVFFFLNIPSLNWITSIFRSLRSKFESPQKNTYTTVCTGEKKALSHTPTLPTHFH